MCFSEDRGSFYKREKRVPGGYDKCSIVIMVAKQTTFFCTKCQISGNTFFFYHVRFFSSVKLVRFTIKAMYFVMQNQTYRDLGPSKILILWRENEFGNRKRSQKKLKNHLKYISRRGAIKLKHSVRNILQCCSRTWANNA